MRSLKLVLGALLQALLLHVAASSASAQSIGLWGGWNEYGDGWQGARLGSGAANPSAGSTYSWFGSGPGEPFPAIMEGGPRPQIAPEQPPIVTLPNTEPAGTILIDTAGRKLYYTLDHELAFAYPISVGREGFTWTGTEKISRIAEWPDWHPPEEMRVRDPRLPEKMYGGERNPLGAVALFLGNSLYRIHGTNDPKTIGYAASSGCFRMMNHHVVHLASLARVGTVVKVLPSLPSTGAVAELPWTAR